MMPDEKSQLLALLDVPARWCRDAEALDAFGEEVRYDDASAVAWDVTGAMCLLFGWERACVLFCQLHRHIYGKRKSFGWPRRDEEMDALATLQAFNDNKSTTFEMIRGEIETMPVWYGHAQSSK